MMMKIELVRLHEDLSLYSDCGVLTATLEIHNTIHICFSVAFCLLLNFT